VKITKITPEETKKLVKDNPARTQGRWKEVAEEVLKDEINRTILGLTRGQAWGVKRTMENNGLHCRVIKKGTGVVISTKPFE